MKNRISSQGVVSSEPDATISAPILSRYGKAALDYSETLGWLVTPARKKHPVVKWSQRVLPALPDRDTQLAWWHLSPCAQIALITGARSQVIAIDADPRHGGSLEAFYARGWPRLTPTARSGGSVEGDGGGHAYYRYPDDGLGVPSAPTYATGCEVHGNNAVMILPPSLHPTTYRRYAWLEGMSPFDLPLAPVPDALLAELRAARTTQSGQPNIHSHAGFDVGLSYTEVCSFAARRYLRALKKVIDEGEGRNNTAYWLARQLQALGLSEADVTAWVLHFGRQVSDK